MAIRAARISRLKTVSVKFLLLLTNPQHPPHSWLDNVKLPAIGKLISQNSLLTFGNCAMKVESVVTRATIITNQDDTGAR